MSLTLEQIEARRAELRAANERAQDEQLTTDMARVLELEEEHGYDAVEVIRLARYRPGATALVVAEVPRASDHRFKRYRQVAGSEKSNSAAKTDAADLFAKSCMLYPSPKDQAELYEVTVDAAPGILGHVALQLVKAVQGRELEEGK